MSHPISMAAVSAAASRLESAIRSGFPTDPVRDLLGRDDVNAAYAVQKMLNDQRLEQGARVIGRKIGLTSPAVQEQLGVKQPDFGVLFDDMLVPDGGVIAPGAVLQPRVEAEVAFVLAEDLAEGDLNLDQIRAAVSYCSPALEICGSRIRDWDISFGDTVADNASAGVFVIGTARKTLAEVEPKDVEMTMSIDGETVSSGTGAACLGDPLLALQWLARQARDLADPLRAGQVVLSGALGPMRSVAPGAEVAASIAGLGEVTVRFATAEVVA